MSKNIRVGITHGDYNGIGYEVIIKALDDERIPELFTPIVFGSEKAMNFYRKTLGPEDFRVRRVRSAADAQDNAVNLVDVTTKEVRVEPGQPSANAGQAALNALEAACEALRNGEIDVLVTAPIDKSSIHSDDFAFPGHTEYLEAKFNAPDSEDGEPGNDRALMILYNDMLRVALVTTHLPVSEIADNITAEAVQDTVRRLDRSLRRDFRIERPRIAVLGLNPHCGDHGVAGTEDDDIVAPAIRALREDGVMAFGPFPSDGFFGSGAFSRYDGVVAMYHDQGLAPFKTIAGTDGVNFTAGLKYVRTSPDHGTGYDIAGRGVADPISMRHAIFEAIDILRARRDFDFALRNPLRPLPADRKDKGPRPPRDPRESAKEQTKESSAEQGGNHAADAPRNHAPAPAGDDNNDSKCITE